MMATLIQNRKAFVMYAVVILQCVPVLAMMSRMQKSILTNLRLKACGIRSMKTPTTLLDKFTANGTHHQQHLPTDSNFRSYPSDKAHTFKYSHTDDAHYNYQHPLTFPKTHRAYGETLNCSEAAVPDGWSPESSDDTCSNGDEMDGHDDAEGDSLSALDSLSLTPRSPREELLMEHFEVIGKFWEDRNTGFGSSESDHPKPPPIPKHLLIPTTEEQIPFVATENGKHVSAAYEEEFRRVLAKASSKRSKKNMTARNASNADEVESSSGDDRQNYSDHFASSSGAESYNPGQWVTL